MWGAECSHFPENWSPPEDRTSISGSVFSSEAGVCSWGHGVSRGSPTRILGVHEPVAVLLADLCDAGRPRSGTHRGKRCGYHPSVLLKLFIYGYLNRNPVQPPAGTRGRAQCEMMWLIGAADARSQQTIADFRRDNGSAIPRPCAQFVELCRRIGTLKVLCLLRTGPPDAGVFRYVFLAGRGVGFA